MGDSLWGHKELDMTDWAHVVLPDGVIIDKLMNRYDSCIVNIQKTAISIRFAVWKMGRKDGLVL